MEAVWLRLRSARSDNSCCTQHNTRPLRRCCRRPGELRGRLCAHPRAAAVSLCYDPLLWGCRAVRGERARKEQQQQQHTLACGDGSGWLLLLRRALGPCPRPFASSSECLALIPLPTQLGCACMLRAAAAAAMAAPLLAPRCAAAAACCCCRRCCLRSAAAACAQHPHAHHHPPPNHAQQPPTATARSL